MNLSMYIDFKTEYNKLVKKVNNAKSTDTTDLVKKLTIT